MPEPNECILHAAKNNYIFRKTDSNFYILEEYLFMQNYQNNKLAVPSVSGTLH